MYKSLERNQGSLLKFLASAENWYVKMILWQVSQNFYRPSFKTLNISIWKISYTETILLVSKNLNKDLKIISWIIKIII